MKKKLLFPLLSTSILLPVISLSCSTVETYDEKSGLYYETIDTKIVNEDTGEEQVLKEIIITGISFYNKKEEKFINNESELIIPDKINDLNVVSIQKNAFSGSKIKTLKLGKNIRSIGSNAFENMQNLTNVDLSDSNIIIIPTKAFSNTPKLSNVIFSEKTTIIGDNAFQNSNNTELTISFINKTTSTEGKDKSPEFSISSTAFESLNENAKIKFININQLSFENSNPNNDWRTKTNAIIEFKQI